VADAPRLIRTPDQRLRVFVSSTLQELAAERTAARQAIERLRLAPVLFELGARPHPPQDLYRAYLDQSHIFVGIYWQKYGWVAPDMTISGLEDEYNLSGRKPKLIYIKSPAPERELRLNDLLDRIRADDRVSYKSFKSADELRDLIENDLALLLTESFEAPQLPDRSALPAAAPAAPALPLPPPALVGRQHELAEICRLLTRDDTALLTLTGSGGTGKTRLALQAALDLQSDFDGVYLVSLAGVTDARLVLPTLAQALGIPEPTQRTFLEVLVEQLRDRHLLLVLDNFEHVISAAPDIAALLQGCTHLHVLVTSRTPLRVRGEKELPVPPLALPDRAHLPELAALSQYAAVELFIQRARDVMPSFTVTNETAPAIAEICHRLDGLPLAIELAASRIKLLSPQSLLNRLSHRLDTLTGGARDLPERQRTLRSAIDWSYSLLDEPARLLFRRISVFAGSWTYDTAEAVVNADQALGYDVFDELETLIDNSLLQSREADGELRFSLLETIREYADEKLAASGEADRIRAAHAAHFAALAAQAEPALMGPAQAQWLDRLELERDNVRAALAWYAEHDLERGLKLAADLYRFWEMHSHFAEGRHWLQTFIDRSDAPTVERGRALNAAGALSDYQGDYLTARRCFEACLAIFQALGDRRRVAAALNNLAMVSTFQLDFDTARRLYEDSLVIKREFGDIWPIANALDNLSQTSMYQHDYAAALAYAEEALGLFRQSEDPTGVAISTGNVGDALLHLDRRDEARVALRESLIRLTEIGEKDGVADGLERLASLALHEEQPQRAAGLFAAAGALRRAIGTVPVPPDRAELEANITAVRARLEAAEFDRAWQAGQALSLEQAVELALKD
jgi:predicted ATPase